MPRSFTEDEKKHIKSKLIDECAKHWSAFGYKKTSVDELCAKAGISKGAFYIFFKSKESLFCETLCLILDQLYKAASDIMEKEPNKKGFAKTLKIIYREYCKNSFICDINSSDFIAFTNKLSQEQMDAITEYSRKSGQVFIDQLYVRFAIEEKKAISVITALLSLVTSKDHMCYDHFQVFDFMVDGLIDKILE